MLLGWSVKSGIEMKLCSITGCDRKHEAKGMCYRHYHNAYYKRRYHTDEEFRRKEIEKKKRTLEIFKIRHPIRYKRIMRKSQRKWAKKHPELCLHYHVLSEIRTEKYPYVKRREKPKKQKVRICECGKKYTTFGSVYRHRRKTGHKVSASSFEIVP